MNKFVQIELTREAYQVLMEFKNHVSLKTRTITNPHAFVNDVLDMAKSYDMDFEPEFSFSELLILLISSTYDEQVTGEVNFIT